MKIGLFFVSIVLMVFPFQQEIGENAIGSILEPAQVPFTFETVGWSILGAVLLVVLGIIGYKQFKLYKKNTYRREAIKKMKLIESLSEQNHLQINQLNILLKQVAIITFGREKVATFYGDDWFLFLESTAKNINFTNFSTAFSKAIYENESASENDFISIVKLTKTWIKTHA